MQNIRRLNALRAQARASFYCCQCAASRVGDAQLREILGQSASARWRLAQAIDVFLTSQPWEDHSRLASTLRDRLACLRRRLRALLVLDRDHHALRWLADDAAALRHAVEICRGLSWSLEISDLLTPRLEDIKQAQRATMELEARLRERRGRGDRAQAPLATA